MSRLRRLYVPLGIALVVCAALVVPLPLYTVGPGESLDLSECVDVDVDSAGQVNGDLLLTFASFRRAAAVDVVIAAFDDAVDLRPTRQVIGDERPDAYFAAERRIFSSTLRTAAAVGLDRAGYPEPAIVSGDGVQVVDTLDGYPASGMLRSGDVLVGVDGAPVGTLDDLRTRIEDGDRVGLVVHRGADVREVVLDPVERQGRYVIGARLQTINQRVELPVDVDVRAGRIGGPSAGLMIALTVYDLVAPEDLLAGRRVAGTGEISSRGEVGPIGSLPFKVASAVRQDASLFLVPDSQVEQARAAVPDGSDLQVAGVTDIDEAIEAIRSAPRVAGQPQQVDFRPCAERVAVADPGEAR